MLGASSRLIARSAGSLLCGLLAAAASSTSTQNETENLTGNSSFTTTVAENAITEGLCPCSSSPTDVTGDEWFPAKQVVTIDAKGARCAVAADFDRDGDMDIVSASSTDNTVAWYEQLSDGEFSEERRQVTFSSNGARIVTTGDIDGDGWVDIIAASYYDHTVGWFKNVPDSNGFRTFEKDRRVISRSALNAQGVTVVDIDGDGDLDVASASSGDNTIAWYENLGFDGTFCEVKTIVDNNAVGARTVVAADFDGDGDIDLASASKDDNTVAWYRNEDGRGTFSPKIVINSSAFGAYSIYPVDLDRDGDMDLVAAANADGHYPVSFFRNDGSANFDRIAIEVGDPSDPKGKFVLSVFAADFDRDGCIDVAYAEFFGDRIGWNRNLGPNCDGTAWSNHTVYLGLQGHYVFGEDMDADGDTDIIAVNHAENQVAVFYAHTQCDSAKTSPRPECCRTGQFWNGTSCEMCPFGQYGTGDGATATCVACPRSCTIPGLPIVPPTCFGVTVCTDNIESRVAACDCGEDHFKSEHDVCVPCAEGQEKAAGVVRTQSDMTMVKDTGLSSDKLLTAWANFDSGMCVPVLTTQPASGHQAWVPAVLGSILALMMVILCCCSVYRTFKRYQAMVRAQQMHEQEVQMRILNACRSTLQLRFSMCFIRFPFFEQQGKLVSYETARDKGLLATIDTYDDLVVHSTQNPTMFISHQWLGFNQADPDNVHYKAICTAAKLVCQEATVDLRDLQLWVDYTCVPQRNESLKELSISSLPVYSSLVWYFVVIAPTCTHHDTGLTCDEDTYQQRGWCRLEQWARMAVGGMENMFVFQSDKEGGNILIPMEEKPAWQRQSLHVFDGNFTKAEDKDKLVDSVLGLWAQARTAEEEGDLKAGRRMLTDYIEAHRDSVFPKDYFKDNIIERLEETLSSRRFPELMATIVRQSQVERRHSAGVRLVLQSARAFTSEQGSRVNSRMGSHPATPRDDGRKDESAALHGSPAPAHTTVNVVNSSMIADGAEFNRIIVDQDGRRCLTL
jgi:hypothetical protein